MKKTFSEFYEFIAKGNVIGLAIGVIMGTAFSAIVNSLIIDVLMPFIGLLTSGVDFKSWFIPLNGQSYASLKEAQEAAAPVITIGNFIAAVINFLIIAVILFFIMKAMAKAMHTEKKEEPAPVITEPSEEIKLLTQIRDALVKNNG